MRYRPYGRAGQTLSALTLALGDKPDGDPARIKLVYAALESGVNGFELRGPEAAPALGKALQAVERNLVLIWLRLTGAEPLDRDDVVAAIEGPLLAGRLSWLDVVIVDGPGRLAPDGWAALATAVEAQRIGAVGVAGEGVDAALKRPEVEVLGSPYHLGSVWADRHRLLTAVKSGRTVIGHGFHPQFGAPGATAAVKRGLFGRALKPASIERTGGYEFLTRTPGWKADEICLGFALTEPSLATIVVEPQTPEDVERLAAVTERELPTGLAAQIEMARFAEVG